MRVKQSTRLRPCHSPQPLVGAALGLPHALGQGSAADHKFRTCRKGSTPDLALREESFPTLDGCGKILRKARQEFFAIRLALPWCLTDANRCKSFEMRTYEKRDRKCRGMRTYKFV